MTGVTNVDRRRLTLTLRTIVRRASPLRNAADRCSAHQTGLTFAIINGDRERLAFRETSGFGVSRIWRIQRVGKHVDTGLMQPPQARQAERASQLCRMDVRTKQGFRRIDISQARDT